VLLVPRKLLDSKQRLNLIYDSRNCQRQEYHRLISSIPKSEMSSVAIRNIKLLYSKRKQAIDCFRIFNKGIVTNRTHKERRLVRFSSEQLYQIVSHVESYHKFVPWCIGSSILRSTPTNLEAELVVGYGMFNEKYISDVELIRPSSVIATSKQTNLLEYLRTKWSFSPCSSNPLHCWVTFEIDFKFKSALYNQVSDMFLQDVINSMVSAFEGRCRKEFCNVEKEKKRGTDTCN
jgi:coenzyme Q-binding protein COQ10